MATEAEAEAVAGERHYIVLEQADDGAEYFREIDINVADRASLIRDLIDGHYAPRSIFAFDPNVCDVSEEIAQAVCNAAWSEGTELPSAVRDFCECNDIALPKIERTGRRR